MAFLPDNLPGWFATIGLLITGLFSLGTIFSKSKQVKEKEVDDAADRLIKTLQGTVTALEKKVDDQTAFIDINTKEIAEERGKNKVLLDILQGRSPEQEKYQADMRQFTAGVAKYMADTTEVLGEISKFMHKLNQRVEKNSSDISKQKDVK